MKVDAIKIGMLADSATVATVEQALHGHVSGNIRPVIVFDPVMVASSGDRLLDQSAEHAVRDFITTADVITPNLPELAVLTEQPVATSMDSAITQAKPLARTSNTIIIVKGGHLDGP